MALLKLLLFLACVETIRTQNQEPCDFYQEVDTGVFYNIRSPNFPQNYPRGMTCRWRAVARTGHRLKLSCGYFDIPSSSNCETDRVSISLTGDNSLSDAHLYCGRGSFTAISENEYLTMQLDSYYRDYNNFDPTGRFSCNITGILPPTPPCQCGWKKQTRIVGGKETGVNEYPFMAGLVDRTKRQLYCGCTIISPYYVLTAAHCLLKKTPGNLTVLVGDHDISTGKDTTAAKLYSVKSFKAHENYNTVTQINDIALVNVDGPITMSQNVMPVCLPFQYRQNLFVGQKVTVLGWGSTQFGAPTSNVLLGADLKVLSPRNCSESFGSSVTTNQMCTFAEGRDACQSDSGGPVLWQDPSTGRVYSAGIISYGIACASPQPGVNTRVTSYLDWIVRNTPDQTYCNV